MIYREIGDTGVEVSIFGLGGHEYLPNGKSRGFNEDFEKATTPGYIFDGFGGEQRKKVLRRAFEHGINFFDVTQDSEKEALGRNLQELEVPYEIYVQTRPEGMVYTYDEHNTKMANYELLEQEVHRILDLLRRDRIDFFNFAFMESALRHDPNYLEKISENIEKLKDKGLIRFACADTFSGEYTYMRQIEASCFDVVYINFNFADYGSKRKVLPTAMKEGMGVITREAFMKGEFFKMAEEAGYTDKTELAQLALKWNLSHPEATSVIVGTGNPDHLSKDLEILDDMELSEKENRIIREIKSTETYKQYEDEKLKEFFE